MSAQALVASGLVCRFGGLVATNDVSLQLEAGAREALIGPNGAGKTTLINLLSGTLAADAGRIALGGEDITRMRPDQRVRRGLVRTFQINQLFPAMSPRQSVLLAASQAAGAGARAWQRLGTDQAVATETDAILQRFSLADVAHTPSGSLPYGKQRLLEIAIAIACRPRVLLLDEPAAGVPEGERDEILAGVAALPPDVAVLLIEHDMDLVFRFARRITVLAAGAVLASGTPAEIGADPRVREVYLGEETND
jgi:ABC-type branched-subunit amino acid transport system ATPase component